MKKIIKIIAIAITIISVLLFGIIGFKVGGTSYCHIKEPKTKEEAEKIISFCGRSDLLFSVLYSPTLAKKYEKFPDEFQNEASSSMVLEYYLENRPLEHLDKIEILTKIITTKVWEKEKNFYFILDSASFKKELTLQFRKKVFNELYEKYYPLILNDYSLEKNKKNDLLNSMNRIKNSLNNN